LNLGSCAWEAVTGKLEPYPQLKIFLKEKLAYELLPFTLSPLFKI
jgi:hypothetical protein